MGTMENSQYGIWNFHFHPPEGFLAVYPVRCGYQKITQKSALENHAQSVLVYFLSGEGELSWNSVSCSYYPNSVLFLQQTGTVSFSPKGPSEYVFILLQNAVPPPAPIPCAFQRLPSGNPFSRMLERFFRCAQNEQAGSIYQSSIDAFRLLMKLSELSMDSQNTLSLLVQDTVTCIREEFAFLTGVDDLASRMGVSKSYLIRTFSAEMGVTPGHFLLDTRLEYAALLLQGREYSIETVAGMCGFSGANYFCKVFRRAMGESPGQYRSRNAGHHSPDLTSPLMEMERRQVL